MLVSEHAAELACARRAWPGIELAADAVSRYFEEREGTHTDDLYLACGVGLGDAAAIVAFESSVLPQIDGAIRRISPDADFMAEVRQRVRVHLLVGPRPRIREYQGRGPLVAWVRIVAVRLALVLLRSGRADDRRAQVFAEEPLLYLDVERELIKARYRAPLREAFAGAMSDLSSHEKNLLQLHLLNGLSLSQIGALHGVGKSTAARWLDKARAKLESGVRSRLRAALRIDDDEIDGLLGVIRSRLDLSIERLLGAP